MEIKNIPGIGPISDAAQNLHLDRSSKGDKSAIIKQIIARQEQSEANELCDPIVIHAEGGTTNGKYLVNFKKGGFVSLLSIWPKVHKWNSYF